MYHIKSTIYLFIFFFLLVGCGGGSDSDTSSTTNTSNQTSSIDKKYFGAWKYTHNDEEIYITSNTSLSFTAVDDNLLQIQNNETTYYLVRTSLSNINARGIIESNTTTISGASLASRSFSGVANINVILENILDKNIKEETRTGEDGSFEVTTLPSGTYYLTATDPTNNLNTTIVLENQNENLGYYKLTGDNLHNFKAELILNEPYIYANTNIFSGVIRVHNISNKTGYGLSYDVVIDSNESVNSFEEESVVAIGSLVANSYKDIPVRFSFNPITSNVKSYGINVTINDALGNTWYDTFDFDVHKNSVAISISSAQSIVNGYIKNPINGKLTRIATQNGIITLPLLPENQAYELILSNPSIDSETVYSIGVNTQNNTDFTTFKTTSAHEPNDNAANAFTLNINDTATSYLHATDIDYWKIVTVENALINEEIKVNPEANQAPIAQAGNDKTVTLGQTVTLDASNSSDNDGYIVSYLWKEGSTTLNTSSTWSKNNFSLGLHTLTLTVTDDKGATASDTILISVNEAPNDAPLITSNTSYNVNEGETQAFTITATDADGDSLTYSLSGTDASYFNINASTGVVTFKVAPDYETKNSYSVIANASDGKLSSSQLTVITINQVYTNIAPVITSASSLFVPENQTSALTISATDTEALIYSLSGTDASYFNINASTGVVTFKVAPDYETKASYSFTANASDGTLSSSKDVTITITNLNDNTPLITSSATVNVSENQTSAFTVTATDADGDSLTYSLSGTDASYFNINASTGVVTFKVAPDYETKASYSFTANVSDGILSSSKNLEVAIININEAPIISTTSFNVDENQTLVGTVQASDPDGDILTYTIVGGDDSDKFSIDPYSGVLSFLSDTSYLSPNDADLNNIYNVLLRVSDDSLASDEKGVNVSVRYKSITMTHNGFMYKTVLSPYTKKVWLDRNLGASQVCTAYNDSECYGDYYQWGRNTDGHEKSDSTSSTTVANSINPSSSLFIYGSEDWTSIDAGYSSGFQRQAQWNKTDGSSICPIGFRVPNLNELNNEIENVYNAIDAYNGFLKLPMAGSRSFQDGLISSIGTKTVLWTTDLGYQYSVMISFWKSGAGAVGAGNSQRPNGFSIRCIEE